MKFRVTHQRGEAGWASLWPIDGRELAYKSFVIHERMKLPL
jgi:hypothetical protein